MTASATIEGYLLTVGEAAEIASCSKRTIIRLIDSGDLPVIQPGGPRHKLRIDSGDLAAYLERSRTRRTERRA